MSRVPNWVGGLLVLDAPVVGLLAGHVGSAVWGAVVGLLWVVWVVAWGVLEARR